MKSPFPPRGSSGGRDIINQFGPQPKKKSKYMKVSAIICELNPFHFGHKYFIDNIKKNVATHVIGIMSGNFTQRSEPSIISKKVRTQIALNEGIDLIIEIPTIWSMSTAEKYAFAGVYIANALGCVNNLCFAGEIGDVAPLQLIADTINSEAFNIHIQKYLYTGITFAKARELAVKEILGENYSSILVPPNNILAVEYLKSLSKLNSKISPYTIKRRGAGHDSSETCKNFASASYIRHLMQNKNEDFYKYIPKSSYEIISEEIKSLRAPADINLAERAILSNLRTMPKSDISSLCDVSEGIEGRIFKSSKNSSSLEQLIKNIKTKRYTMARIKRLIMYSFLGITKYYADLPITYIRVLGFNSKGLEILKKAKKTSSLPIVTKFSQINSLDNISKIVFAKECSCTDLYNMMLPSPGLCGQEQKYKIVVKNTVNTP
ncbi:MAG: nucleotidyltransferase family protein [Oscillospiraceae bacterium]|nr:nucleotidyltransferase family protein [Oscillospiraceae bacterium]